MSNAKGKSSIPKRVSLSMLKGRPGSLSVPSFSFRFNPNDDDGLEEVCELGEDITEEKEGTRQSTPSPPPSPATPAHTTTKNGLLKSKKSKRTLSLDGSDSPELTAASADTWSILSEIRGKIVRTVEEAKNRIDQHVRKDTDKEKPLERTGSTEIGEDALGEEVVVVVPPPKAATGDDDDDVSPSSELRHRKTPAGTSTPSPSTSTTMVHPVARRVERGRATVANKIGAFAVFLTLLNVLLPLPDYLNGLVTGVVLVVGVISFWRSLTRLPDRSPSGIGASETSRPSREGPAIVSHQVWMNELLSVYTPGDFHIAKTQSVLVSLDGTILRLSYPGTKIPKRATWNEPDYDPTFVHERVYDLEGAEVDLLPRGLARKRHWSRRYPIRIFLSAKGASHVAASTPIHLTKENDDREVLLFARTGRDKEEWFRKLEAAAGVMVAGADGGYGVHMARLILSPAREAVPSPTGAEGRESVAWLNALLGRAFWSLSRDGEWSSRVAAKIQKKLSMIQVPSFIEEIRLSGIELGQQLPQVLSVGPPVLDDRGLWVDVDVSYYGAFQTTLETKLNLMRPKRDPTDPEPSRTDSPVHASSYDDDDAEESIESSSDEEPTGALGEPSDEAVGATAGRKILKLVDSIAQSRYFQHAAEYKYVKKAMEGVSNTPIVLTVELVSLSGTLVLNVPPPPSDRLWYGFRDNPNLTLVAKPKVGEREVPFTQIIEWIEKKLIVEFQRILVLPNMDDLVVPFGNPVTDVGSSPRRASPSTPTSVDS